MRYRLLGNIGGMTCRLGKAESPVVWAGFGSFDDAAGRGRLELLVTLVELYERTEGLGIPADVLLKETGVKMIPDSRRYRVGAISIE